METGIADDAALLNEPSDAKAAAAVPAWAALGIDDVRIFVQWQAIAPGHSEVKAPGGFNAADPDSPGYNWSRVDRAVDLVSAAGMRPMLVVTGPGPLWASQVPARHSVRYKPRPDLFGQFARAAALRYGGGRGPLDHLERAQPAAWLQPQNTCMGKRCTPVRAAPVPPPGARGLPGHQGRRPDLDGALRRPGAARREPDEAERPDDAARLHPSMGCVKATLKRDRSGPCKGFQPLTGDGLAYHPHATTLAPDAPQPILDKASIGDLPRLERTLDATQRAGGLKKPGGGSSACTSPSGATRRARPTTIRGVSLAKQSRYLQQGAYIAYKDPRVKLLTQYEWRDEPVRRSASDHTRAGSRGCASPATRPSRRWRASPTRSSSTSARAAARPASGARCARATGTGSPCSAAGRQPSAGRR